MNFICRVVSVLFLALSFSSPLTFANNHSIPEQTLNYAVTYGRYDAGELDIEIAHDADGYVVTSNGKPSLLASFFLKSHYSQTHFPRRNGKIVLARGNERVAGKEVKLRDYVVDRAAGKVVFNTDLTYRFRPTDRFEAAVFPLLLMLRAQAGDVANLRGDTVREVGFRRVRDYRYDEPMLETISVPAGEFDCWKISRHQIERPENTVTIWLRREAAGVNPLPVKMSLHIKGTTSNFVLQSQRNAAR